MGQSKFAKDWGNEEGSDLATFARTVEVAQDRLPGWPADRLVVLAEHSSLLYDTVTESIMEKVR